MSSLSMPAVSNPPCSAGKPTAGRHPERGRRPAACKRLWGGLVSKGGSHGTHMDSPLAADESCAVSEQRAQILHVGNEEISWVMLCKLEGKP